MKKAILAAWTGLIFYTLVDIGIWDRLFETDELWPYHEAAAPIYHLGWSFMLWGLLAVGALLLWGRWKEIAVYCGTLLIFTGNGMEDILYYLLDFESVPARLDWLDGKPLILFQPVTAESLWLNALVWLLLYAVGLTWLWRAERRIDFHRRPLRTL
mgnify:CR=1 FL=1